MLMSDLSSILGLSAYREASSSKAQSISSPKFNSGESTASCLLTTRKYSGSRSLITKHSPSPKAGLKSINLASPVNSKSFISKELHSSRHLPILPASLNELAFRACLFFMAAGAAFTFAIVLMSNLRR